MRSRAEGRKRKPQHFRHSGSGLGDAWGRIGDAYGARKPEHFCHWGRRDASPSKKFKGERKRVGGKKFALDPSLRPPPQKPWAFERFDPSPIRPLATSLAHHWPGRSVYLKPKFAGGRPNREPEPMLIDPPYPMFRSCRSTVLFPPAGCCYCGVYCSCSVVVTATSSPAARAALSSAVISGSPDVTGAGAAVHLFGCVMSDESM
jgi:hypothetical protein